MERLDSSQNTPQEAQVVESVEVVDLTERTATVDVTDATMAQRSGGQAGGSTEQAKERAKQTAEQAKGQAKEVAADAKQQARSVVQSAGQQTRGLVAGVGEQVSTEVESQKGRLAQMLRELGDELDQAAGRTEDGNGRVAMFASEAATRSREASSWLESHQARDLVDSVSGFARRRPMAFIAGSLVAGMVVGRLTRGMVDVTREQGDGQHGTTGTGGQYDPGYTTGGTSGSGTGSAGEAPVSGYGYSVPAGSTGEGSIATGAAGTPGAMAGPDEEPMPGTGSGTGSRSGTPGTLGGLP
jgi:ElaB/YqjD/DUF883 family membrane-anchored ribosome-binding protein